MSVRGARSTGVGIKSQVLRKAAEDAVRDEYRSHEEEELREKIARGDRLSQVVEHKFFSEVEAILIQDVMSLASASDDNLLIRASSARGSLRSMEKIWTAIREGEQAVKYLAELERAQIEEKQNG